MASESTTMRSLGMHGHWGFSSAFDMLDAVSVANEDQLDEVNVLLVSPGDIRHILCTLSKLQRRQRSFKRVNFYLLETPMEVLARDLVLLELFCDFEIPVRQRATVFLEVFGNLKVQRRTNAYMEQLASRLRYLLSKGEGVLSDVLDFSHLGYRERDALENSLKLYDRSVQMDMDNWFDHRKRGLYEERYDNRKALFDWDYHAGVKQRASIVHIKQFKHWREKGIAYEFGDQEYVESNRSMTSFAEGFLKSGRDRGLKKEVMGYWGDIVCSPYFAFGIDCDTPNKWAEGLFEIYNKGTGSEQHRHHAVEVALFQLFSFMWELETNSIYQMTRANDVYSGLGKSANSVGNVEDAAHNAAKEPDEDNPSNADTATSSSTTAAAAAKEESVETAVVVLDSEDAADGNRAKASSNKEVQVNREQVASQALDTVDNILSHFEKIRIFPLTVAAQTAAQTVNKKKNNLVTNITDNGKPPNEEEEQQKQSAIAQLLSKAKYQGLFHGVFISARYAQLAGSPALKHCLKTSSQEESAPLPAVSESSQQGLHASNVLPPSPPDAEPSSTNQRKVIVPVVAVETAKFLVSLSTDVKKEFSKKVVEMATATTESVPHASKLVLEQFSPIARRRRDETDREDDVLFFRAAAN